MLRSRQMIGTLIALALTVALTACGSPSEMAEPTQVGTKRPGAPIDLDGTEWELTSLNGSNLVEGSTITLAFPDKNYLQGSAGCNSYGADYVTSGNEFHIPETHRTEQDCDVPEGVMQQETAYFEALRNVATFGVIDDRLELGNAGGEPILTFAAKEIPTIDLVLMDTEWVLTSLDGNGLLEGSHITLNLGQEGFDGFTGCNRYGGEYAAADEGTFTTFRLWYTEMECKTSPLQDQEQAYIEALNSAAAYRVIDGRLEIDSTTGETTLVFATEEFPKPTPGLDGTEWVLASLNGDNLVEGSNITLAFAEERVGGFAGCNSYGSQYTTMAEGSLTISLIEITLQLCQAPEGVMEQEAAYIEALQSAAAYRVMDDRLEIEDAAGRTIPVFARKGESPMNPSDLVGTEWQLLSWNGDSLIEGSTITLAFHNEYYVSGHAGCRGYVATYEASGDDIGFLWFAMMGDICTESEALMEQEGQYTTILGWATDYRLGEGKLEVLTARGEVLVFESLPEDAAASLEGATWALTAFIEKKTVEGMPTLLLMPTDLLAETDITATFEDGTMRGSAGCNTYGAAYALDGSSLHLEIPAATEMACSVPAGVMEQEQRYLAFPRDVNAYHIYGNQLWLETNDGRALAFTAPERRDCTGPNAFPTEEAELIWPELREVQPDQAAPGDEVEILGSGGHLYWDNECGEFWLESARDFQLFFDGEPAGFITCYANMCVTNLTVPEDAVSGTHVISVEGGSSLIIEVGSKPTPSPVSEATPTNTSTPQPTATGEADVAPIIHYFRANVEEADPGDTIVLEWESSGATPLPLTAILYHITPSGQLPQYGWDVAPSGVYTYQISPDERNLSQFFLYVYDEADRGDSANLAVKLRCPVPWFFEPAPEVCASYAVLSNAAEQHFERGAMIWVEDTIWVEQKCRIFVLYDDGQHSPKWESFSDEWDEGESDHDPSLTPPAGLYQPVRGFGLVWRERPQVRDRLGWAIDRETGFSTIMQVTTKFKYNSTYLRALDGNVWHLGPEMSSWEKITVTE